MSLGVILATKDSNSQPSPPERQADADDGAEEHIASRERSHGGLQITDSRHFAEHTGKNNLPRYQLIGPSLLTT